jgi:hypothetical protein
MQMLFQLAQCAFATGSTFLDEVLKQGSQRLQVGGRGRNSGGVGFKGPLEGTQLPYMLASNLVAVLQPSPLDLYFASVSRLAHFVGNSASGSLCSRWYAVRHATADGLLSD